MNINQIKIDGRNIFYEVSTSDEKSKQKLHHSIRKFLEEQKAAVRFAEKIDRNFENYVDWNYDYTMNHYENIFNRTIINTQLHDIKPLNVVGHVEANLMSLFAIFSGEVFKEDKGSENLAKLFLHYKFTKNLDEKTPLFEPPLASSFTKDHRKAGIARVEKFLTKIIEGKLKSPQVKQDEIDKLPANLEKKAENLARIAELQNKKKGYAEHLKQFDHLKEENAAKDIFDKLNTLLSIEKRTLSPESEAIKNKLFTVLELMQEELKKDKPDWGTINWSYLTDGNIVNFLNNASISAWNSLKTSFRDVINEFNRLTKVKEEINQFNLRHPLLITKSTTPTNNVKIVSEEEFSMEKPVEINEDEPLNIHPLLDVAPNIPEPREQETEPVPPNEPDFFEHIVEIIENGMLNAHILEGKKENVQEPIIPEGNNLVKPKEEFLEPLIEAVNNGKRDIQNPIIPQHNDPIKPNQKRFSLHLKFFQGIVNSINRVKKGLKALFKLFWPFKKNSSKEAI